MGDAATAKEQPTPEGLVAACVMDLLVPIRRMFGVYPRTAFYRWQQQGLRLHKVPGMGVCVKPSELQAFMARLEKEGDREPV